MERRQGVREMKDLQKGQFVRVWPTGEIGMIMKMDDRRAGLMFVNNGPLWNYDKINLIPATSQQIKDAGLHGIGCVEPPE